MDGGDSIAVNYRDYRMMLEGRLRCIHDGAVN